MGPLVVLAYSGGLDTSAIVPWLREKYGARVLCFAADVGQGAGELGGLVEKAKRSGAVDCVVEDLREEFVRDFVFPTLRAGAERGEHEVAHEFFAQIFHDAIDGAGPLGLFHQAAQLPRALPHVRRETQHTRAVFLAQPGNDRRGVESARVCEDDQRPHGYPPHCLCRKMHKHTSAMAPVNGSAWEGALAALRARVDLVPSPPRGAHEPP